MMHLLKNFYIIFSLLLIFLVNCDTSDKRSIIIDKIESQDTMSSLMNDLIPSLDPESLILNSIMPSLSDYNNSENSAFKLKNSSYFNLCFTLFTIILIYKVI